MSGMASLEKCRIGIGHELAAQARMGCRGIHIERRKAAGLRPECRHEILVEENAYWGSLPLAFDMNGGTAFST